MHGQKTLQHYLIFILELFVTIVVCKSHNSMRWWIIIFIFYSALPSKQYKDNRISSGDRLFLSSILSYHVIG